MWIDAHHHLWSYNDRDYVWMTGEMQLLRRDFLIPELESVFVESGIGGSVAVQARQSLAETEWLLQLAGESSPIRGVVGWVPLVDARLGECLDRLSQNPRLKGVRHVLHDEADDSYMLREDFNRGVDQLHARDLTYDILVFERHLPQTIQFVDRHPNQVFILDHIAKPRIRERILSPWKERLQELAKRDNVYCKLSGMVTQAWWNSWTRGDLVPFFEIVLSAFGPKRLMFGSDWPVLTLASSYKKWNDTVRSLIAPLSTDEQELVSSGSAIEAYRLP
ncbi:MAG TPA: amidohydrolase family protein [Acidobacteriaceae bacterium]|nr:amidohydrolase family protein [Acidobacteriaceae bacterium]